MFATLPGVSAPPPFGGNQRTIVVTLDPDKLREYGVSPEEATGAVNKASVVMPSGNIRIGNFNLFATSNATLGGNLGCNHGHSRANGRRTNSVSAGHRNRC